MNIENITSINNITINGKTVNCYPVNPVFIILLTENSFEIFPKHNGYDLISESFALN